MFLKIYLLRHGQTDWNKEKRLSCGNEAQLNQTGIEQAKCAGEILKNIDYNLVICSPYDRTKLTCKIANVKNMLVIFDNRLREREAGVLDGKYFSEFTKEGISDFFNYNKNVNYENAENIKDFCKRVWRFLDEIKLKYKDKNILLVTHNIVIRAIKAYKFGIPENGNIREYGIKNAEIEKFEI